MYKPNESSAGHAADGRWTMLVVGTIALWMPLSSAATTRLTNDSEPPPSVSRTSPTKPKATGTAKGGYRVQCWQHGRLLFEEAHITLPPADGSRFSLKLTGYDSNGRPMYVAETTNATCLVRYDRTLFNPALPH